MAYSFPMGSNTLWFHNDYQEVIMKPNADAGLMDLAKANGYCAETLTQKCYNFRSTHLFLLQAFEAFSQYF